MEQDSFKSIAYYLLALQYVSTMISALMTKTLLRRIGPHYCLMLGGIGYFAFTLASTLLAYKHDNPDSTSFIASDNFIRISLLVGSFINGFG